MTQTVSGMNTIVNIRHEMLNNGYTFDHTGPCPKCGQEVDFLVNGSSKQLAVNPEGHPTRPNALHALGCGVKAE